MCGRYSFSDIDEIYEARRILEEVAKRLGDEVVSTIKTGEVFPTEVAAVVTLRGEVTAAEAMRWGYPLNGKLLINARSETVSEKPLFARSMESERCLIPCTGFFEWKAEGKRKQKYLIKPEGVRFFYLAGMYRQFIIDGRATDRFVILTAPANDAMKEIHPRMPLIVHAAHTGFWLGRRRFNDAVADIYRMTGSLDIQAMQRT
jgi:putative SOS response-associated peptidase YedK